MPSNLPDNWGDYYNTCTLCGQRYHASEGCECEEMTDYEREKMRHEREDAEAEAAWEARYYADLPIY